MSTAVADLSYSGTFVYRNAERMDSLRIVRRKNEDGVRERLLSLTGLPTEVLRNERKVICILPKTRPMAQPEVVRRAARPRNFQLDTLALSEPGVREHYSLQVGKSGSRVAGRPTVDIEIVPTDEYRYGYMLSLDRETSFPLKSRLVASDGEVLEEIQYTDVDFDAEITDEMLRPEHMGPIAVIDSGEDPVDAANNGASAESGATRWSAGWLPPGFHLTEHFTGAGQDTAAAGTGTGGQAPDSPRHHLVYSDGVVSVSVFIEPLGEPADALEGPSIMGATHAYGAVRHGVQVISVGRVPATTVARIAAHIEVNRAGEQ